MYVSEEAEFAEQLLSIESDLQRRYLVLFLCTTLLHEHTHTHTHTLGDGYARVLCKANLYSSTALIIE